MMPTTSAPNHWVDEMLRRNAQLGAQLQELKQQTDQLIADHQAVGADLIRLDKKTNEVAAMLEAERIAAATLPLNHPTI